MNSRNTETGIKTVMKLAIVSQLLNIVGAQYDYSELVDMSKYNKDFRSLSCWECYQARGKMCIRKDD